MRVRWALALIGDTKQARKSGLAETGLTEL